MHSSSPSSLLSTADISSLLKKKEDAALNLSLFTVIKRNGHLVPFKEDRIRLALIHAFQDTKQDAPLQEVELILSWVLTELEGIVSKGGSLTVEGIQDVVELGLMKKGHHDVARDYIVYRDKRKTLREDSPLHLKIMRSDGSSARFNPLKIARSLEKAFRLAEQKEGPSSEEMVHTINLLTQKIVERVCALAKEGQSLSSQLIDDETECQLMQAGFFSVAKHWILHRGSTPVKNDGPALHESGSPERRFRVKDEQLGEREITDSQLLHRLRHACQGLESLVSAEELLESALTQFYEGIKIKEVDQACIMAARSKIEIEPAYSQVAARLLLDILYRETMHVDSADPELNSVHQDYFKRFLMKGVQLGRVSADLLDFDLEALAQTLQLQRDDLFSYLGLQTLYDRYFLHHEEIRIETPQIFWMRVAMGLALNEGVQRTEKAIEFYHLLSQFLFCSGTPTLFNSGTCHSQLSSCYLSTVSDDLSHIFKVISDNAQLSKWAGGIGNDWTAIRATGAHIQGTNGKSQGIIPFLKVANDAAVAVNQGGKRKGAVCAYLETWHLDIEDFLELRKNTGDERRRTHDMNTANWIPDLFMKRVSANAHWTLFSPSDVPDLHDLYGKAFEERYVAYEEKTQTGQIKLFKRVEALQLWRKMLSMLFETGHPWLTFKDPSNIRSPQDHQGVIHCSNLCTEILLNNSKGETAVCNLGSINLAEHVSPQGIDEEKLAKTVRTAIRMLDNVIDINFYPTQEAKEANLRHRPIGLGIMGFQDALYIQGISYASHEAVQFADVCMEQISYYALLASSELAKERGAYSSYTGSKWDRGLLPIDTIALLKEERGGDLEMDTSTTLNWNIVRESIKKHGMRNSNTLAIAPTATISNIMNCTQSIEPMYKHLFVKSNLSGEFTVPNLFLVRALKERGLWDQQMLDDLKYFDGSISEIERIPQEVKQLFLTAFEIDPEWTIACTSRRQKWVDMGISHNLYVAEPSGKKLHQMYFLAWKMGLKTTYYLRSLSATTIEKSTTDINKRGLQPRWMKNASASSQIRVERDSTEKPRVCHLGEGCESCQ